MKIDKEKLKNIDKLPADVRRELALLMNKHDQKTKEIRLELLELIHMVIITFVH